MWTFRCTAMAVEYGLTPNASKAVAFASSYV